MINRITIDIDAETENLINEILSVVAERIDSNVELSIRQEIVPERISGGRIVSRQEKEMISALRKKGVM